MEKVKEKEGKNAKRNENKNKFPYSKINEFNLGLIVSQIKAQFCARKGKK